MSSSIDARPLYRKPFLRFHEEAEQLLAATQQNFSSTIKKLTKLFLLSPSSCRHYDKRPVDCQNKIKQNKMVPPFGCRVI